MHEFPFVRELGLELRKAIRAQDTTPVPPVSAVLGRSVITDISYVTSLTLSGACFKTVDIGEAVFRTLLTLRLVNVTAHSSVFPTLFEMLRACPSLRELVAHVHWTRCSRVRRPSTLR